jgi:hypothetical protein
MAPMSFLTYEDVRPWARAIRQKVSSREMQPWYIDRTVGIHKFRDDPSLSDGEIATIVAWVDAGPRRASRPICLGPGSSRTPTPGTSANPTWWSSRFPMWFPERRPTGGVITWSSAVSRKIGIERQNLTMPVFITPASRFVMV